MYEPFVVDSEANTPDPALDVVIFPEFVEGEVGIYRSEQLFLKKRLVDAGVGAEFAFPPERRTLTTLTLFGQPITFTVVGWFATLEDSGEILLFHLDDLRAIEEDPEPWGWFAEADDGTSVGELRTAIGDATNDRAALRIREPFDDLDAFQVAFAIITVLVLAVGLANLAASTIQMMQERTRDVAVLKTLGFTPTQVVASVVIGASAIAVVSALVGGLLAIPLYNGLMDTLGVELGVGPGFGVAPDTAIVIALLLFVIAATAALAGLAAQRPSRSGVAEVLRAE